MKPIVVSLIAFLTLATAAALFVFIYLFQMRPAEIIDNLSGEAKFFLYRHGVVERLSGPETKQFYRNTCTRTCHSSDLIEKKPRTAAEWDRIVKRMQAPDRADIPDHAAAAITRYLQNHFLSNIPTVLPEETMKFVKQHLWKSDFGESDLYLDIIYIPRSHRNLLPYLVASNEIPASSGALFVVYLNTHQGTIPPWNLTEMAALNRDDSPAQGAIDWKIIYEDGQFHHRQGLLLFPDFDADNTDELLVSIHLPGMRERAFQWTLPIPELAKQERRRP